MYFTPFTVTLEATETLFFVVFFTAVTVAVPFEEVFTLVPLSALTLSCFVGTGASVAEPVAAYAVHTEPNIIVAARIPTNAFFIKFFMKIIPPFF